MGVEQNAPTYMTMDADEFVDTCIEKHDSTLAIVHPHDDSSTSVTVDSVLRSASEEHDKNANFYRVQGSSCPEASHGLGVNRFPCVLVFKDGKVVDRLSHFGESDYFTLDGECRMLKAWVDQTVLDFA